MQISKVSEGAGAGEGGEHAAEYRTANELFDLMTKNTNFGNSDNTLSAEDLVLLYQNIDIGTRLMKGASQATIKKSNQHVETVVYHDDHDSGSDCSEIFNPSDIQEVFMINQERLDFLNDKSFENLLCPKLGGFEMHTSNLSFDYDKNFLFQDPYIKTQLLNLNPMGSSSELDNLFSTSLIDYICCKRLEDNYSFYMDNIIRYVQNTIEQLKRISNGEYLTERVKEKWMEVNCNTERDDNTKVLATSTSIPLHVHCKASGNVSWDDIVHSEVDVRSLSKILEKKIIVEIPKLICGSYRLFSRRCADNLIISCRKDEQEIDKGQDARVDVVFQLKRSQTGRVMSKISSVMVLKTAPAFSDLHAKEILPLPCKNKNDEHTVQDMKEDSNEAVITVVEVKDPEPIVIEHRQGGDIIVEDILKEPEPIVTENRQGGDAIVEYNEKAGDDPSSLNGSCAGANDHVLSDQINSYGSFQYSSGTSLEAKDTCEKPVFTLKKVEETAYHLISPDELHTAMRKLNMRKSILNENSDGTMSPQTPKRRSPVRVRIKSPYENKSFLMEEKKRKRLLEIRERREKKKIALSESCKISKHKYVKGAVLPQASNSVTKLSITNKSFYNSIYGHNSVVAENKPKYRKYPKTAPETTIAIDENQEEYFESPMLTPNKNSKKYINRSYYLDDAETEMMYIQMKNKGNKDMQSPRSVSDSNASNEINADMLQEIIDSSETNLIDDPALPAVVKVQTFHEVPSVRKPLLTIEEMPTPLHGSTTQNTCGKASSTEECRKSIDQLYVLMNRFGKPYATKVATNTNSSARNDPHMIQGSESSNVKLMLASNNSESPGKNNMANPKLKSDKSQPVVPKVLITSKTQLSKNEADKLKKERNRRTVLSPPFKGPSPDNPLKAISQLLHQLDPVQKNKQKPSNEVKMPRKVETVPNDCKIASRQDSYRRKSRIDQHVKDKDQERKVPSCNISPKDRKNKPMTPFELARNLQKQVPIEDKTCDKIPQKKMTDIIDEAKEARGEAVRGPSKNNSRLYSLAQPKKHYIQAHQEEYQKQNRYGRNILAERLQKLATPSAPATVIERPKSNTTSNARNRWRKSGTDSSVKQRAPSVPLLDQHKAVMSTKKRRSPSCSPEAVSRAASPGHKHSLSSEVADGARSARPASPPPRYHAPALEAGLRCRVPLVPTDIDLVSVASWLSAEEAGAVATVRRSIAPAFNFAAPAHLAALTERTDSLDSVNPPRSESDYCVNLLEDSHVATAVSAFRAESFSSHSRRDSITEMEQLETALYTQISGAFQKRLRLRNLTLTPKPSSQQVFLLQSGDAGSVLVKSISNIKLKKSSVGSLDDLKAMPVLSNSHLDWNFTQLPVQIATVGYAFPERRPHNAGSKAKLIELPSSMPRKNCVEQFCQSSQCLRGLSPRPVRETGAQVDVVTQFSTDLDKTSHGEFINPVSCDNAATTSKLLEIETARVINEVLDCLMIENGMEQKSNEAVEKSVDKEEETDMSSQKVIDNSVEGAATIKCEIEAQEITAASPSPEAMSCTTSLDILVGLLTEIQKITGQNQMVTSDCNDLDICNTIRVKNTACDLISLNSLENLRRLESNVSIYSYYVSNDEKSAASIEPVIELRKNSRFAENSIDILPLASGCIFTEHVAVGMSRPALVDKEVSVNLCGIHMPTDLNRLKNTGLASNLMANKPSPLSTLSVSCNTLNSSITRSSNTKEIIEWPQIETRDRRALVSRDKVDLNKICFTAVSNSNIENVKKESLIVRSEIRCCVQNIDLDPMFRIKRDLLVSMYSILVLTVFAALSFPELLLFQS